MKKNVRRLFCLLLCVISLSGCCLRHDWEEANCEQPRTCSNCGKTKGSKGDHEWEKATCKRPKTCEICGKEKGELGDHKWRDATCIDPETCAYCGKTRGDATGHRWDGDSCLECGATRQVGEMPADAPVAEPPATEAPIPAEPGEAVVDGYFNFTADEFLDRYDAAASQLSTPVQLGDKRYATDVMVSYYMNCKGQRVLKVSITLEEGTGKITRIAVDPTDAGEAGGALVEEAKGGLKQVALAICTDMTMDEWNAMLRKAPASSFSRNGKTYDTFITRGVKFAFTYDDATGVFSLVCTPDK